MGGRFGSLNQLCKKFRGNYVFPLPKLIKDQIKKTSSPEIKVIFPRTGEDQKKIKGLRRNLRPFSAGNLQDLLVLAGYFSSGHPALNSRWEDA